MKKIWKKYRWNVIKALTIIAGINLFLLSTAVDSLSGAAMWIAAILIGGISFTWIMAVGRANDWFDF